MKHKKNYSRRKDKIKGYTTDNLFIDEINMNELYIEYVISNDEGIFDIIKEPIEGKIVIFSTPISNRLREAFK